MEEKFNLFKSDNSFTYTKMKEDYLDISFATGTAQNKNNVTGNLDFKRNTTDTYFDLCEAAIIAEIIETVAADKT